LLLPGNDQIEFVNLVTKYRLFISNLLNDLLKKNSRKYQIICNCINAEQTEFNKESTKIRKIKAHVYLSRYCDNKKSYNIQRQTFYVNILILGRFIVYILRYFPNYKKIIDSVL